LKSIRNNYLVNWILAHFHAAGTYGNLRLVIFRWTGYKFCLWCSQAKIYASFECLKAGLDGNTLWVLSRNMVVNQEWWQVDSLSFILLDPRYLHQIFLDRSSVRQIYLDQIYLGWIWWKEEWSLFLPSFYDTRILINLVSQSSFDRPVHLIRCVLTRDLLFYLPSCRCYPRILDIRISSTTKTHIILGWNE